MALTSPGVEVTVIDQSQYLPAPTNSVPLVVLATAQNKANPAGVGIAQATTAANAGKLFQVTSQRDLVTLYGNPFFYTSANGSPIQGYELNEYGLLAAYSLLGVTNRCYVLRADIDLASLVGQTGRPIGNPENGSYWLDTTTSEWGIYQWNFTTEQFTKQTPIVITDATDLDGNFPAASVGNIGNYAVVAIPTYDPPSSASPKTYFYKNSNNLWVEVGSYAWLQSVPAIVSTTSNPTLVAGTLNIGVFGQFTVEITIGGSDTVQDVAAAINGLNYAVLSAEVIQGGRLAIYSTNESSVLSYLTISASSASVLTALGIPAGTYYQPEAYYGNAAQMPLWSASQTRPRPTGSTWLKMGSAGDGFSPVMSEFNATTARWVAKDVGIFFSDARANAMLDASGGKNIPAGTVYAQYNYNSVGTAFANAPIYFWQRLASGSTVVTGSNTDPSFTPLVTAGSFVTGRIYTITSIGTTNFTSIGASSNTVGVTFTATGPGTGTGTAFAQTTFVVLASTPGSFVYSSAYQVSLPAQASATDFVTAFAAANIPYTQASVTTSGAIQLSHTQGGVILIDDTITVSSDPNYGKSNGVCAEAGFVPFDTTSVKYGYSPFTPYSVTQLATSGSGINLEAEIVQNEGKYDFSNNFVNQGSGYSVGDTVTFDGAKLGGVTGVNNVIGVVTQVDGSGAVEAITLQAESGTAPLVYTVQLSNWVDFDYTANEGAPVQSPANNTNWFYSVIDEVDIMVNTVAGWRGYRNVNYDQNGFPAASGVNATDPNGPIVSASEPTTQSDGTALVYGDLWISTADLEQYPIISRWQQVNGEDKWVLINNTDQVSSSGVLFADARWASNGNVNPANDPIPTIKSLLTSNYLDLDAPANSLYPIGMLLFNTRRSGYNVKQFRVNYFNATNFPDETLPAQADAWVTVSGNMENGAPYMGRKAQRNMVVQSLRSVMDTNTDIRDEDNFFNLMATPNYPELQPNMVALNSDRGETAYIIGDTPMGLPDQATALQAWATNAAGATSTGEDGCVTRNTYLGLFYPSGLAPEPAGGNLVAVPPSHMMLRTFLRNDTIAYPWLAAAGTRRGVIDNATNIGYLDRTTGEFVTIKTRIGIRDVLYTNFINPLVFFTGNGLLNYGNKTSFNSQSALDRTNVARLIAFIRRQLTIAARPFVFEPNDSITRQQIAGVVESLMIDLVAKRGIYDYLVVCDESNNTPARIDRNELWVDVAVEPVKAAEFIYIPVRVLNTGELNA